MHVDGEATDVRSCRGIVRHALKYAVHFHFMADESEDVDELGPLIRAEGSKRRVKEC